MGGLWQSKMAAQQFAFWFGSSLCLALYCRKYVFSFYKVRRLFRLSLYSDLLGACARLKVVLWSPPWGLWSTCLCSLSPIPFSREDKWSPIGTVWALHTHLGASDPLLLSYGIRSVSFCPYSFPTIYHVHYFVCRHPRRIGQIVTKRILALPGDVVKTEGEDGRDILYVHSGKRLMGRDSTIGLITVRVLDDKVVVRIVTWMDYLDDISSWMW